MALSSKRFTSVGNLPDAGLGLDTLKEILRPLACCLIAAGIVLACSSLLQSLRPSFLRLFVENAVLFGVYFFVMGQKAIYLPMLRELGIWPIAKRRRQTAAIPPLVHD